MLWGRAVVGRVAVTRSGGEIAQGDAADAVTDRERPAAGARAMPLSALFLVRAPRNVVRQALPGVVGDRERAAAGTERHAAHGSVPSGRLAVLPSATVFHRPTMPSSPLAEARRRRD